jgi:hypothetical protein
MEIGRQMMGMTNRQRREALTPMVHQYRASGDDDVAHISRETGLPQEDVERIFRDNPVG